jgi:hypothetical protein
VVTKSCIFGDITSCSLLQLNWRFEGTCLTYLQFCLLPASCWFFAWLTFQPWRWRRPVPSKRQLTFNRRHRVISQKTELFKTEVFGKYIYLLTFISELLRRNKSDFTGRSWLSCYFCIRLLSLWITVKSQGCVKHWNYPGSRIFVREILLLFYTCIWTFTSISGVLAPIWKSI